jgi:hypothetical protein
MENSEPRRQSEAWLPRLLTSLNRPRTQELIPQFAALSREEKAHKAISVFQQLTDNEPNVDMGPSRRWPL